ncbi:DUF1028 domain-containing protein [uncultured Aliiroseovarius sp.]|uniref:DUF1028 domain-containing protein n=1 Tax=uncultured Aliiroseovarius sp. TaxID=1658783 RepID=UPI002102C485|nr:DUF1028 domain-containing protein [Aliiroseovarius sediminis]
MAFDENTNTYGGAAATGSLCVGGWVLRGNAESGLSASQGSLPSTFWGDDVLALMKDGAAADTAVNAVTGADTGRDERQLSALDKTGGTAAFTGAASIQVAGVRQARHAIVAGNLLESEAVLDACLAGFLKSEQPFDVRLLSALDAAAKAGGDSRGLLSAALLVVRPDAAPLSLRIDHSNNPLVDLHALHRKATTGAYANWAAHVPTLNDPFRAEPYLEKTDQPV